MDQIDASNGVATLRISLLQITVITNIEIIHHSSFSKANEIHDREIAQ